MILTPLLHFKFEKSATMTLRALDLLKAEEVMPCFKRIIPDLKQNLWIFFTSLSFEDQSSSVIMKKTVLEKKFRLIENSGQSRFDFLLTMTTTFEHDTTCSKLELVSRQIRKSSGRKNVWKRIPLFI